VGSLQWLPVTAGVVHWDYAYSRSRRRITHMIDTIRHPHGHPNHHAHPSPVSVPPTCDTTAIDAAITTATRMRFLHHRDHSVVSAMYQLAQKRSHVLRPSVDQCLAAAVEAAATPVIRFPHERPPESKPYVLTSQRVLQFGLVLERIYDPAAKNSPHDDRDECTQTSTDAYAHIMSELHRLLVDTGIATSITADSVAIDWSTSHGLTSNMVYPLGAPELDWLRTSHKRTRDPNDTSKQVPIWQPMRQLYSGTATAATSSFTTPRPQPSVKTSCRIPFYMVGSSRQMMNDIGDIIHYQHQSHDQYQSEHGLTMCRAIMITLTPIWMVISRALPPCLITGARDGSFIDTIVCYLWQSTWQVDDEHHDEEDDDDD
jgi:hypothetical protein